jgi:hypothetical protein
MSTVSVVEDVVTVIEVVKQGPPGPVAVDLPVTDILYDGLSRVISYTRGGVDYDISYPSTTSIVVTGGGITRTITLDPSGRVVSVI